METRVYQISIRESNREGEEIQRPLSLRNLFISRESRLIFAYLRPMAGAVTATTALALVSSILEGAKMVLILAFIHSLFGSDFLERSTGLPFLGSFGRLLSSLQFLSIGGKQLATLGILIVTFLAQLPLDFWKKHLAYSVQQEFVEKVRVDVLDRLLRLELGFFTSARSGDLVYLMNTQVGRFSSLIPMAVDTLSSALNVIVLGYILVRVSPFWTLLVFVLSLLLWVSLRGLYRKVKLVSIGVSIQSSISASIFQEILYGIRLVKLAALEGRERSKYLSAIRDLIRQQVSAHDIQNLAGAIGAGGAFALMIGVAVAASLGAGSGLGRGEQLLGYAVILTQVFPNFTKILEMRLNLASMFAHFHRVGGFLLDENVTARQEPGAGSSTSLRPFSGVREHLGVEGVTFNYHVHRPALEGVSLTLRRGTMTALVGLTGSGKSTLLELIARFLVPQAGRISVDDVDIREFTLENWRQRIGYVAQEVILFNDSIGENIRCLRPGASQKMLEEAAEMAAAHEFIQRSPKGYETQVGERGLLLSGGERQRIALARVFLRDPDILLLDEATSALDLYTEAQIFNRLFEMKKQKVIIVAAHRLSAIARFDQIVVLHHGRVIEQGTHDALMSARGLYYHLSALQEYSREEGLTALLSASAAVSRRETTG